MSFHPAIFFGMFGMGFFPVAGALIYRFGHDVVGFLGLEAPVPFFLCMGAGAVASVWIAARFSGRDGRQGLVGRRPWIARGAEVGMWAALASLAVYAGLMILLHASTGAYLLLVLLLALVLGCVFLVLPAMIAGAVVGAVCAGRRPAPTALPAEDADRR